MVIKLRDLNVQIVGDLKRVLKRGFKMSFKIRMSLITPIGTKISDDTFEFDKELQAKDMLDMCKSILNKYCFETYDEYLKTVEAISRILQGYEYTIKPVGRKEVKKILWFKKGKPTKEDELK